MPKKLGASLVCVMAVTMETLALQPNRQPGGPQPTELQASASPVASPFQWPNGKRVAVSLSFDDARFSQVDTGLALLSEEHVKATFFVQANNIRERLDGWKKAVADRHEIGNHSLSHPCTGNYAFSRDNALEDYSLQ